MPTYKATKLQQPVLIDDIVTIHYFEYDINFRYYGERHDFWEIVYADKGDLFITAEDRELLLQRGHMFLHKPMEFHNIRTDGSSAPNSVIVSFFCSAAELYEVVGRSILCTDMQKNLLAKLLKEAVNAFSTPLGKFYATGLERRAESPFGGEQLVKLYLEQLLISLVRRSRKQMPLTSEDYMAQRRNRKLVTSICQYIEENTETALRFEDICATFSIGASTLQKLFATQVGSGVMQYYGKCKIERAKQLIREDRLNVSEIAERLRFSSIHYFSRRFKTITGMSPSEYAQSVKAYAELEGD